MRKGFIPLTVVIFFILFGSLSCQSFAGTPTAKKSVVVTYSILGSIVKELAGHAVTVTVLIPNGMDPHDWEPSARDIENINKADLVVRNGLDLEGNLDRTLEAARKRGVKIFTAGEHISIRYVGEDEHSSDGHSRDDDHSHSAGDPHLWTDPIAVRDIVRALSEELRNEFDLDVSQQAAGLENRLENLDREIAGIVSALPQEKRHLVTGHESMGYFACRYDFDVVGVIIPGLSSQAEVSAANMADLKTIIEKNHVSAIFTELGTSPAIARAIGQETGAKVVELDTHTLPADGSYFTFMRNIAITITEALK